MTADRFMNHSIDQPIRRRDGRMIGFCMDRQTLAGQVKRLPAGLFHGLDEDL
jgi:hypothetical protein